MADILMKLRLRWLGHLAQLPKQLLFAELVKKRPNHGTKRRWSDVAAADIKTKAISEGKYDLAQERSVWITMCKEGPVLLAETERYRVSVASLSNQTELKSTLTHVKNASEGKKTVQDTADSVRKPTWIPLYPPHAILSREILPRTLLSSRDTQLPRF